MPGFILHLTAAKILLDKYKLPVDENAFYIGNLLPDSSKDKARTHFRAKERYGKMVEYPELDQFLEKYESLLVEDSVLGYYYHLYIDRKFFTEFYPQSFLYLNHDMKEETEKDCVVWAYIYKTKELIPINQFLSEEYYYGDFTRMNTWLVEKFDLPMHFDTEVENPGIEEVDYQKIENVLAQLKGYLAVPTEAINNMKVFELEKLLDFLEEAAKEWYENFYKNMTKLMKSENE